MRGLTHSKTCWQSAAFRTLSPPRQLRLIRRLPPMFPTPDRRPSSSIPYLHPIVTASAQRRVKYALDTDGHTKFGFVVYRTTYTPESDVLWPKFLQVLQTSAHRSISRSDTPELITYLDHRFVEDRARLDGATASTLRTLFNEWRKSPEAQAEQPQATTPHFPHFMPRYRFCVRADAEVLRSVCDAPQPDPWGEGFVDFIDADWRSEWERKGTKMAEENKCPPIEGCEEEDVGWMRLAASMMSVDAYDVFSADDVWYTFYERPPVVVNH